MRQKKIYNPIDVPRFALIFAGTAFLICLISNSFALSSGLPMQNYNYLADFEISDPFEYWTSNGSYLINFKGLSKEKASCGVSSFKLDVTLGTATYLYFKIPINVPSAGQLQFTGDLFVESSSGPTATLGTNVSLSPAPHTGIKRIEKTGTANLNWITQKSDWVEAGAKVAKILTEKYFGASTVSDVGIWTNKIGLFIYAPAGGRIVLYVDNILAQGVVPENASYMSFVTSTWQKYLLQVQADIKLMADSIINYSGGSSGTSVTALIQAAKDKAGTIKSSVQSRTYPTPVEYTELKNLYLTMKSLSQYVSYYRAHLEQKLFTFPCQPITSVANFPRILPSTIPGFTTPGNSISIQACRGEYEPASFVVRAEHSVSGIQITTSDLISSDNRKIPASAVDIKLVKCWYQADDGTIYNKKKVLLPELLLNDDKLVKVDYVQQRNYLKVTIGGKEQYLGISLPNENIPDAAIIKDADVLLPFDLNAETNKQIWVTVHIPVNAVTGDYRGTIRLQVAGISSVDMNITVSVLPFDLQPSLLEYSIYYRGKLPTTPQSGINSEWKTTEQYLAELQDMKAHGVVYPTIYQNMDAMLGTALSLRNQVGFPKDHLYSLGLQTGNPTSQTDLDTLGRDVTTWINFISQYGYNNLYAYGIDEASGEILQSERAAWQKVIESGAKVFVACNKKAADLVGDLLDVPILAGAYKSDELLKFHNKGKKVFSYGNPQAGIEDPEIYRRNYGLGLACANYDGAMDYAYQHGFGGHIWNDFDHVTYRDHVFAYPTSSGVIDTVQWEGFREAVDDVRYLATLISLNNGQKASILSWLCPILTDQTNMSELRAQLINAILQKANLNPFPKSLKVLNNSR